MRRLFLLRHAKSGEDAVVTRDFDRPLNAKGRRAGHAIGRYLRAEGLRFDAVIASPAVRVVETLAAVADGYGASLPVSWARRAYLAPADELLDLVRDAPPAAERLLVVAHNPGLEELALLLARDEGGGRDGPRDRVAEKYPTATLAELALDVAGWADAAAGSGRLVRFVRPRDLDPALGPDG